VEAAAALKVPTHKISLVGALHVISAMQHGITLCQAFVHRVRLDLQCDKSATFGSPKKYTVKTAVTSAVPFSKYLANSFKAPFQAIEDQCLELVRWTFSI
jgi:hypothetical protein